jgi:ACR3 family arsenite efflux pump ArsB
MNSQDIFGIVAMFYAMANLGSMGIELDLRETVKSLRSFNVLGLTLGWSWLIGPILIPGLTVSSWAIARKQKHDSPEAVQ